MKPMTVPGTLDSLGAIAEYVLMAAREARLAPRKTYKLRLAVDEIATNAIAHGYADAGLTGNIEISSHLDDRWLAIYLEDTGIEYDPTQKPPPADLNAPLKDRQMGGLGVYLALEGVDRFQYERLGGKNRHIFMVKRPGTIASEEG